MGARPFHWWACLVAALASGAMVASGFAPWESVSTPLFGLSPLLAICWFRSPGESFRWGFLSGAVTWLAGLTWLLALHETALLPWVLIVPGWIAIALYCALYTGLFAWAASRWMQWTGRDHLGRNALGVLVIPLIWIGLEWLRANLVTGFPWNPLGATQAPNPAVSQAASLGGVYLVSGIVVLFNVSVAFTIVRYLNWRSIKPYRPHVELFIGLTVMAACTLWGRFQFRRFASEGGNTLVAVVQPAIVQNVKWDPAFSRQVHRTLTNLTVEAVETGKALGAKAPDLVIWPETATPEDISRANNYREFLRDFAATNGPLLVGALIKEDTVQFNSTILFDARGEQRYDKQHLVPFGEYIPFDRFFPALQNLSPLGLSLKVGTEPTVFDLPGGGVRFSTTICFEDIFPDLSRQFVRHGARLLVNQSNDAWFDGTAQHRQHLNLSIMRCIENRVPGVRVSNSGESGFIEANGRVYHTGLAVSDDGWLGVTGPLPGRVPMADVGLVDPPPEMMAHTLYTRYGDWLLGIPAAVLVVAGGAAAYWIDRKRAKGERA